MIVPIVFLIICILGYYFSGLALNFIMVEMFLDYLETFY